MIRRHVLAALAAGVDAGTDEVARAEVARSEWLLRGRARRELERVLIDATLVTGEFASGADPDAMRHVQRVAALTLAGRHEVDATDRSGVAAAYGELPAMRMPRTPVATIVVAIALVLLGWSMHRLRAGGHRVRGPVPLVAGAFFTGGEPVREPALERLLADELTALVIETDGDRHGSGADRVRQLHAMTLRVSPVITAHGPALAAAWRDFIDALDAWVDVPARSRGFRDAEAELTRRAHAVSDQLAALGLGYYVEADVFSQRHVAHAAVFAYRVEEVVFEHAAGQARRVLGLRRLDRLNLVRTLLGMQSDERGDPVVLLDQIDEFATDHVMPALEPDAPYELGDDGWRRGASGDALARAAGGAIRRDVVAQLGVTADRARVARLVAATVRRHETRHGIDNDRETPLRLPVVLAADLGSGSDDDSRRFALRARAELAAYTSQIANDPTTPQLALWNLASQAFHRDHWGSAESYAALIVLEGLARQFGTIPRQPLVRGGQIDRSRLAELALPLASLTDDALRRAARGLWLELYGEPSLPITE